VKNLGLLQQRHGTYAGLCLALDIVTDGTVARGRVVPVENFRLRRTFSTVLGLSWTTPIIPLPWDGLSGNSIVGDSLILTEDAAREFLALFAPELAEENIEDKAAVEALFDRYSIGSPCCCMARPAPCATAVQTFLAEEVPAHLLWTVQESDHPFVLGLSPLLALTLIWSPRCPSDLWLPTAAVWAGAICCRTRRRLHRARRIRTEPLKETGMTSRQHPIPISTPTTGLMNLAPGQL